MLNGDGNENSQKISVGLISKKTKPLQPRAAHFFYTFLCRCFAPLQRETSINLCVPVHFFFSPPLIFTLVAASISPFSHRRYKIFMFFFQRNWSPLFFISRSNSSSVIHVNVGIEIKLKERIGFHCYCVSISKRPGSYAETRGCLKCKISSRLK